ncbi:MAG: hypothetical protein M3Y54_03425 [Bacteroidota bacterium]|nr:hypothetical protein [Bacteroidota bacterium]
MQVFRNYRGLLVGIVLATACAAGRSWGQVPASRLAPRPTQAQVGSQFLRAILRADYEGAYRRLAPEVRRVVTATRFGAIARPLWKTGQRHASPLELYKLGVRLGENGSSRLFYSFSFAADSALPRPSVLLEVTFRDTASRGVLSFGQKPLASPRRK